jgi:hypothetical protein
MDGYMEEFQAWAKTHGLSDSTFRVYRGLLRGFLRDAERVENLLYAPGLVEKEALAQEEALADSSRSMFRSALRAFLRFAAEKRGIDPATLTIAFPDRRAARWKAAVASPAASILTQMAPHLAPFIGPKILERLTWQNVRKDVAGPGMRNAGVECGVISDTTSFVNAWVPIDIMRALALWAGGGKAPAKDLPLIPTEPLSYTPMPAARIRRFTGIKTSRRIPIHLRRRYVPGV